MSKVQNEDGRVSSDLLAQLFVPAEAAKAIKENRVNGEKRRRRTDRFFRMSPALCHKLCQEEANWAAWAMVFALYEAWYASGWCAQHLNPFPLQRVNSQEWGLSRLQKFRSLQFLVGVRLLELDQSDPENPLVTIAWEPKQTL